MSERTHKCDCHGHIRPGGICGWIVCSSKLCGAPKDTECEHRVKIIATDKDLDND